MLLLSFFLLPCPLFSPGNFIRHSMFDAGMPPQAHLVAMEGTAGGTGVKDAFPAGPQMVAQVARVAEGLMAVRAAHLGMADSAKI